MKTIVRFTFYCVCAIGIVSCQYKEESLPVQDSVASESTVIPIEKALAILQEFLNTTKGQNSEYDLSSVKVITTEATTKSLPDRIVDTLLYCVNIIDGGTAVLSANTILNEPIYAVTDETIIDPDTLYTAVNRQIVDFFDPSETIITIPSEEELMVTPIEDCGEDFVISTIASYVARYYVQPAVNELDEYTGPFAFYPPLLRTKWHQDSPFKNLLNYDPAGCTAIAAAQTILNLHQVHPSKGMVFEGKTCTWSDLESVCNISNPTFSGTAEQEDQAAHFVKYIASMANFLTNSGSAYGVKQTFEDFGLRNVSVKFAMSGGNSDDVTCLARMYDMIHYGKPTVLCAFDPKHARGHTFVIDGYKKDETGTYMHVCWGWINGLSDGYFPWGLFKTTDRHEPDSNIDTTAVLPNRNYNSCHYYVLYEK